MKIRAVCAVLTGGLAVFSSQVQSQKLPANVLKQDLTLMVVTESEIAGKCVKTRPDPDGCY
jgi:hypothetical protein